ncbi:hypothetical protein NDU88_006071 [Pleurodeles waltl]|uniref:Uncharacterized protein n=1 Tax=Pleurodeles waltl TaxID=8319 RepID=A0AAV7RP84_PLEWA|nr:hypothetical protein NDU88_006071 [Pleurodeles waltl]
MDPKTEARGGKQDVRRKLQQKRQAVRKGGRQLPNVTTFRPLGVNLSGKKHTSARESASNAARMIKRAQSQEKRWIKNPELR